jgi:hypothetical protein
MARLRFTPHLRRFVDTPDCDVTAATLGEALHAVFTRHPRLRDYVLDDQGHLRPHVVVFIDGRRSVHRRTLADPLRPDSDIHILQALSGG